MFDFRRKIYDDFVSGDLVFVAKHDQIDQIEEMVISFGDVRHNLVFRSHSIITDAVIVGHKRNHDDWNGQETNGRELCNIIALQWDTVETLIDSLNNDSLDEIIHRIMNAKAYLNINPMDEDVSDMVDLIGSVFERDEIMGGHDYDSNKDLTPTEYIRYLYGDCYRNVFLDPAMDEREMNASNDMGIGTESSSIYPSVVYPIAYLVKKDSNSDGAPLYTEEDFSEIFD